MTLFHWLELVILLVFLYLMLRQWLALYAVMGVYRVWPALSPLYGQASQPAVPPAEGVRWFRLFRCKPVPAPHQQATATPLVGVAAHGVWLLPVAGVPPQTYKPLFIPWAAVERAKLVRLPLMPGLAMVTLQLAQVEAPLCLPLAVLGPQGQWPPPFRRALQQHA